MGLYFHFLATYAKALTVISALGGGFWLFGASYPPHYSIALILWATTFVEYWKIVERKIPVRWGIYGAFQVEKLRHDYDSGSPLQRDFHRAARVAASIPVILGFVAVLAGILTMLFAIEAFITSCTPDRFTSTSLVEYSMITLGDSHPFVPPRNRRRGRDREYKFPHSFVLATAEALGLDMRETRSLASQTGWR